jgi:hypothetical protein
MRRFEKKPIPKEHIPTIEESFQITFVQHGLHVKVRFFVTNEFLSFISKKI